MKITDYSNTVWERNISSYTSGGAYLKATVIDGETKYYLKLSNYDDERGFIGFESVYEYFASVVGAFLGFDVLPCELLKVRIVHNGREHITFAQKTADFREPGMSKMVFERYYVLHKEEAQTRIEFLRKLGFSRSVDEMFIFDFLIYNRDRHANNLEFLKNGGLSLAPFFDNGVSFFAPYAGKKDEIEHFDVLSDNITNGDFGTRYLRENLSLVENKRLLNAALDLDLLKAALFKTLADDSDFPDWHRERVFDLLKQRYEYAKDFFNN